MSIFVDILNFNDNILNFNDNKSPRTSKTYKTYMEPLINATAATPQPSLLVIAGQDDAARCCTYPRADHETCMQSLEQFACSFQGLKFTQGGSTRGDQAVVMVT